MLRLVLPLLMTLTATPAAADVVVFAAASLKTALDEVAQQFQAATGETVVISYAGSNTLARQILEGAPADLYVSAAENWMDLLEEQAGVAARRDLLGNRLVLVAPAGAPGMADGRAGGEIGPEFPLMERLGGARLSMALVEAVPAGQYGRAALESLGFWEHVKDQVAQSDNVRAALTLVARAELPLGIVYETDARAEPGVQTLGFFAEALHPPIRYPVALLSAEKPSARAFYDHLSAEAAAGIFQNHGFQLLPAEAD